MENLGISIVIPALNEAENLKILLPHLQSALTGHKGEIIVCCAGAGCSRTQEICGLNNVQYFCATETSRAFQMNYGAEQAKYEILYFVHADTLPPKTFVRDINVAMQHNFLSGCYRFKFDQDVLPLMINSFFTRFRAQMFRGGDQTLFVERNLFNKLGGYDVRYRLMEEYPFIKRLKRKTRFKVMSKAVLVSSRKYDGNPYVKVNLVNLMVFILFHLGLSSKALKTIYTRSLNIPRA